MRPSSKPISQGALFEEDYLVRTLGSISHDPEIALTELVANARDAGSARVSVLLPRERGESLVVEDDGVGMTAEQFRLRWMTLGYDRLKHQGAWVEFPNGREGRRRRAFGRNGVGRHGLLCFADAYEVETTRDGRRAVFRISTRAGKNPFEIVEQRFESGDDHGTRLTAVVTRNLPNPERIRQVLGARFLQDPEFEVLVNGSRVPMTDLDGFILEAELLPAEGHSARVLVFDSQTRSRIVAYQGIAFWVSGKLVGTPSWVLGDRLVLDGRTRAGRRFSVVVQCDDSFAELVDSEWSSFQSSPVRDSLWTAVAEFVSTQIAKLMQTQAAETSYEALHEHRDRLRDLPRSAAVEVVDFAKDLTGAEPNISSEALSAAIQALIKLEKSRYGAALLEKVANLPEEDVEALDRLLSEWTVRDALTVLDEIDTRLKVVEAIERLGKDEHADEVRTLHPLVTQARWIFGPEFDSPEYASNASIRNAAAMVFARRITESSFINARKRPDLVVLADATLSIVGAEAVDPSTGLSRMTTVLLIELKRGRSEIGRDEMNQADGYVQDLLQCGHLDGPPFIRAFVVGHRISERTESTKTVGTGPKATISATTFAQLTRTASQRLFKLRDRLTERYEGIGSSKMLEELLSAPSQLELPRR